MRLIICGSRHFNSPIRLNLVLTRHASWHLAAPESRPLILVHGACPTGADKLVDDWFEWKRLEALFTDRLFGLSVERHPADWRTHGKAAGPFRNREMAEAGADRCIAFLKRGSANTGTLDMIRAAHACGITVETYES